MRDRGKTAPYHDGADACSVDVAVDATGRLGGSFECSIPNADGGGAVSLAGLFGCPLGSVDRTVWNTWSTSSQ